MIRGEKPFVARERTNNILTQPMHVWRRFRDISPGRIFCASLPIPPQAYIYAKKKHTHFNTAQVS